MMIRKGRAGKEIRAFIGYATHVVRKVQDAAVGGTNGILHAMDADRCFRFGLRLGDEWSCCGNLRDLRQMATGLRES